MNFPIGRRQRAVAECLRLETRRAVLAELKPSVRNHPEWSERVTRDGRINAVVDDAARPFDADDVDLSDLLQWARRAGIGQDDLELLVDTEQARASAADRRLRGARNVDDDVARAHGICARTLYRRRRRTLTQLQTVARDYLVAVA